jgi:ribosome biogenesis GTPase
MRLEEFGWNSEYHDEFLEYVSQGCEPARVRLARREHCVLLTARGDVEAMAAGRLWQAGDGRAGGDGAPVVGDWVALSRGIGRVEAVLRRRTEIARRRPGAKTERQVLAANVDVLLVVSAFGRDFSLRRLERYLLLARQGGAEPVVVLNKVDECADPAAALRQVRPVAEGAPVVLMSALQAVGLDDLLLHVPPGKTAALLGSSGVGKSTIINRLLGLERQRVSALGEANRRGRHTTTDRELIVLTGGQLLIDTPGLRELQLWAPAESMDAGFGDIAEIARACRFRDCRHQGEPGCAVAAAVANGEIEPQRVENFHKIGRELAYLERQSGERAVFEEKQRLKRLHRQYREAQDRKSRLR